MVINYQQFPVQSGPLPKFGFRAYTLGTELAQITTVKKK